ncbi:MAG: efflux RND transporter periplasmic adaptor subunit [Niabella sp.]
MKKYFKYSIILLLLIILVFFILRFWGGSKQSVVTLQTAKVTNGAITTSVTATGTVEPVDQIEVGTQVSGLVQKIYVDYNSTVKKGQLLAELDKTNLREAVSNAQASYNAALNELQYYQQNYTRQNNMYNSEVISKADYEQAAYQLKNAEATVAQRKTSLVQAQTNLGYANIYSPIDGVVITKDVEEGQTVAASMTTPTLFTIAKDITKMQVEANVDEADIGEVRVGQRVTFTVDAYPQQEFTGKVKQVRLGATTTSNVVTYTVIIDADNPEQKLKPGLTATVTIFTKELNDIPTIDVQAINFSPDSVMLSKYYQQNGITSPLPVVKPNTSGQKTVWIKKPDGSLQQKEVALGTNDGVKTEVTSGLSTGEEIVLRMEESKPGDANNEGPGNSPFMPKMPSRNNKKSTAQ